MHQAMGYSASASWLLLIDFFYLAQIAPVIFFVKVEKRAISVLLQREATLLLASVQGLTIGLIGLTQIYKHEVWVIRSLSLVN